MKVLVGCEFSRTVASAFERAGHYAMSCDLLPAEAPGPHYRGDIMTLLDSGHQWDLAILHPDCTYMAVCGNRHHAGTENREEAVRWTIELWNKAIEVSQRVCLENPQSVIFKHLRALGADVQYVQPDKFGHPETKKTGLALHNLPELQTTWDVSDIMATLPPKERHRIWYASPSETRSKDRSRFFPGIGRAMAEQWGMLRSMGRVVSLPAADKELEPK